MSFKSFWFLINILNYFHSFKIKILFSIVTIWNGNTCFPLEERQKRPLAILDVRQLPCPKLFVHQNRHDLYLQNIQKKCIEKMCMQKKQIKNIFLYTISWFWMIIFLNIVFCYQLQNRRAHRGLSSLYLLDHIAYNALAQNKKYHFYIKKVKIR